MPASTQLCHLGMVWNGIHPWWTRGEGWQLAPKGFSLPPSLLTSEGNIQCPQRCRHRCMIRDRRLVQPSTHSEEAFSTHLSKRSRGQQNVWEQPSIGKSLIITVSGSIYGLVYFCERLWFTSTYKLVSQITSLSLFWLHFHIKTWNIMISFKYLSP